MKLVQLELLKDLFHDVLTDLEGLEHLPSESLLSEISLLTHQHESAKSKNSIWFPKENIPH